MSTEKRMILKASGVMAVFTLVSRVLGLVRNQVLSHFFGATMSADAFIAAFTIPNALRRLFGEGALTPAIVSLFTRVRKDRPDAQVWVSRAFTWCSLAVLALVAIGITLTPLLVQLYVPNFKDVPGKLELTITLTRLLFPFILFIGWAAFFMGILNTVNDFAAPAFGPAALNITVICLVPPILIFGNLPEGSGIFVFAGAVLLGGLFQALVQIPSLVKNSVTPRIDFSRDKEVGELFQLLFPSLISLGIYQLNIIVNRIFASDIEGAVSHLFYADLVLELPISLIAVSFATAVIPSFSRLVAEQNKTELAQVFKFAWHSILFLAAGAMMGLLALTTPILSTLYFSGKFTWHDLESTKACLIFYSLGLPFFALQRLIVPLYFAEKDTKTPVYAAFFALFVNLFAAWQLSKSLGAPGIALATTLSSLTNFAVLLIISMKRHPYFPWGSLAVKALRTIALGMVTGVGLWFLTQYLSPELWIMTHERLKKVGLLSLYVLLGFGIFVGLGALMKDVTALALVNRLKKRFVRRSN